MKKQSRKIGTCRAGGEKDKVLDSRNICSICAFKMDSADKKAEDIQGIRRDMERMGVPVMKRMFYENDADSVD